MFQRRTVARVSSSATSDPSPSTSRTCRAGSLSRSPATSTVRGAATPAVSRRWTSVVPPPTRSQLSKRSQYLSSLYIRLHTFTAEILQFNDRSPFINQLIILGNSDDNNCILSYFIFIAFHIIIVIFRLLKSKINFIVMYVYTPVNGTAVPDLTVFKYSFIIIIINYVQLMYFLPMIDFYLLNVK